MSEFDKAQRNEIKQLALKELERIFVEVKADYIRQPEHTMLDKIQIGISNRILKLEDETEKD